jgi:uncharacterized protein (DUF2126 family)
MSARNSELGSVRNQQGAAEPRRAGIGTKPSRPAQRGQLDPSGMSASLDDFESSVLAHDRAIARAGVAVWVGAEPTFTDRFAETREWLSEALGADKEQRARALVAALRERHPGGVVLRTIGRQYAGEPLPRWSYGLYARRDGEPVWLGPPDRLLSDDAGPAQRETEQRGTEQRGTAKPKTAERAEVERAENERAEIERAEVERADLEQLRVAFVRRARARGWTAAPVELGRDAVAAIAFRCDGSEPETDPEREPRLARASIHTSPIPATGLVDDLAASGTYLVLLSLAPPVGEPDGQPCVELPAFPDVATFLELLAVLGAAALSAGAKSLALYGYPPPVDRSVLHQTFTPDPAVLEVNQAPAADLSTFLRWNRELFGLAEAAKLAPIRLQYTGLLTDSGGGGQVTIGGPTPAESPFFVVPQLLPRLVRYLLRHPSLSYWFATQYVGGGSQSPRPDEGLPQQLYELGIALEQLGRAASPSPTLLWETLRHFLADYSGNPHRSELNIEKLYNTYLPGRGCLGLVEFRALRMQATPERLTAIAMLLRALIVMLTRDDVVAEPTTWGGVLHDRFALPTFLRHDLGEVFADLTRAGFGLGSSVEALLLAADERAVGALELEGCRLDVEQACEFWPLVGDVVSQESGGSRIVDASTSRLEVRLSCLDGRSSLDDDGGWQVSANGYRVPLVDAGTPAERTRLFGVRFRTFVPMRGLHPSVPVLARLDLHLCHRQRGVAALVSIHGWRPDGSAYPGLPVDVADAARRRAERFVVQRVAAQAVPRSAEPPAAALSAFCLDLRRC